MAATWKQDALLAAAVEMGATITQLGQSRDFDALFGEQHADAANLEQLEADAAAAIRGIADLADDSSDTIKLLCNAALTKITSLAAARRTRIERRETPGIRR